MLDPARLPKSLRVGQPQSLDLRAQVVLNDQPNPVGVPFQFTVTPTDAAVATPVAFSDDAGRFTTVYTPSTTAPTFNVRACLVLNDANGTTGSDICVTQQVSIPAPRLVGVFDGSIEILSRVPCRDPRGNVIPPGFGSITINIVEGGGFGLVNPGIGASWAGQLFFFPNSLFNGNLSNVGGQSGALFGALFAVFEGPINLDPDGSSLTIRIRTLVSGAQCDAEIIATRRQ